MSKAILTYFAYCIVIFSVVCNGQRAKDMMYEEINGATPCIRRMNATHQMGCSSGLGGSTGVIYFVERPEELDTLLANDNGLEYIPTVPVKLLRPDIIERMERHGQISGLIVYGTNETKTVSHFSHEDKCPNFASNLDETCKTDWNAQGTGMLRHDMRFPVHYVTQADEIGKIKDCYDRHNNVSLEKHPEMILCAIELRSFMIASIDSETCIRRSNGRLNFNPVRFCDPMGDLNIWASLFPVGTSKVTPIVFPMKTDLKYIIVAAKIDSTSMFLDVGPGADSPVSGIVTLMATAKLLKQMLPEYNKRNVLFVLFHGESYDYIGSQRLVYDMNNNVFPTEPFKNVNETVAAINMSDIALYVEISQIGASRNINTYTLNAGEGEVRNFLSTFKKYANITEHADKIPPASLQSFVNKERSFPGLVLTDHGDNYENKYYNSIYDDAENLHYKYVTGEPSEEYESPDGSVQEHVEKISGALALTLHELITVKAYTGSEAPDGFLINELFHCYLEDPNCLVHKAVQRKEFNQGPFSLYVSVFGNPNILTSMLGLTLGWLTGTKVADGPCAQNITKSLVYRHFNMSESLQNLNTTYCFRTQMNFTDAESPAFIIEDYDFSSGEYSTWTESAWKVFNVRLYLKPLRSHEITTFAIGCVVFGVSIMAVWLVNARAGSLFESDVSPANC